MNAKLLRHPLVKFRNVSLLLLSKKIHAQPFRVLASGPFSELVLSFS
jgi:hypothetical protein